jgi:hypothetical protein
VGCKEVAAKEWQRRSGSEGSGSKGVAAKNITDITDPTPAPPLEGRGWLRINPFCKGSTAISLPTNLDMCLFGLFFVFLHSQIAIFHYDPSTKQAIQHLQGGTGPRLPAGVLHGAFFLFCPIFAS